MTHSYKLSLWSAILININIMLGSGVFINTALLTSQSGSLGAVAYLLVGIMLLPLIWAIAQLISYHPDQGTFYHFGLTISPFFGFISGWSYFVSKMCSFTLGIHVCVTFLQQLIPVLTPLPTLLVDLSFMLLFTGLNMLNIRTGRQIQFMFVVMKLIPLLFAILSGLYLFNPGYFTPGAAIWSGVPLNIPFVVFAFLGFEATCSLSRTIENPTVNGPKAIFISYGFVVSLVILYQLLFYSSLGTALGSLAGGYLAIFPALISNLQLNSVALQETLTTLLSLGIASSSLGSAYGIMFSNSWNLYTLAEHNHVYGKKFFLTQNKFGTFYGTILIEACIAIIFLFITRGNQVPLQQVGALGSTIGYSCSALALLILTLRRSKKMQLLPLLSLLSCLVLLSAFLWNIYIKGPTGLLVVFLLFLILGTAMFQYQHNTYKKTFENI